MFQKVVAYVKKNLVTLGFTAAGVICAGLAFVLRKDASVPEEVKTEAADEEPKVQE